MTEDEDVKPELRKHYRPFREPHEPDAPIEGCIDEDGYGFKIIRDIGEVWRNRLECNRKTCLKDGTIIEEVCPEVEPPPGCLRINGFNFEYQDFPYCCDRVACPGEDEYWEEDPYLPERCDDRYCVREIGEVWTEHKYGLCNRKRCLRNKYNEAEIFTEKCPKLEVPKGCKLEAYPDLTKDFPDCCEKIICPPGHPANLTLANNDKSKDTADSATNQNDNSKNKDCEGNRGINKPYGSDTENRGARVDVKSTREDKSWNSYRLRNITEMFKDGAVKLYTKNYKNVKSNKSGANVEDTIRKEHKSKHKKERRKETGKNISSNEKQDKENQKGENAVKRRQTAEDTVIVNASESENKINKYESGDKSEHGVKARAAEKLRSEIKTKKNLSPLGDNMNENENIDAKHSHKSKRKKDKKRREERERKEDIRDVMKNVIKIPKNYTELVI